MRRHSMNLAAGVLAIVSLAAFSLPLLRSGSEAAAQQSRGNMRGMDMKGMDMKGMDMKNMPAQPSAAITRAICVIHPLGESKVAGKVTFTKQADGVAIHAEITGLTPGEHGFHIHEWGDCSSADGMSTGGHYNPTKAPHAGHDATQRHVGDFGNITADASGKAMLHRVDTHLALEGPNSIIGRAMIVHANRDDLTTQPSGNAGGRVACGVIGIANPAAAN
jgi:Cu-Zn family superoxide dismutase